MPPTKTQTQWKDIPPVPSSVEFLDIVLARTQRRLPTQIRAGFKISRIRGFYTRKVKFTQETCMSTKYTVALRDTDPIQFPRRLATSLRRSPVSTKSILSTRTSSTLFTMPTISALHSVNFLRQST